GSQESLSFWRVCFLPRACALQTLQLSIQFPASFTHAPRPRGRFVPCLFFFLPSQGLFLRASLPCLPLPFSNFPPSQEILGTNQLRCMEVPRLSWPGP